MHKIVVTNNQDLSDNQKRRLEGLGHVTFFDTLPRDAEEYLKRIRGADIVGSGTAGLKDAFPHLRNIYVTVAFVSVAFVDLAVLKANGVTLSNAPGANRHAVSEWIMAMTILLVRDMYSAINRTDTYRENGSLPPITPGLAGNKMAILGNGHIGRRVNELARSFGMDVSHFKRGDDLHAVVRHADVVVDALSSNPSTKNLLDDSFVGAMKQGSCFVTVTRSEIVDSEAMLRALDSGHLRGVATDCGGILVGDAADPLYARMRNHPRVLATPHISYNSEMSRRTGADIMIDNIEAWIEGKPQNVLT